MKQQEEAGLSVERLLRHTRELSRYERLSGSEEERRAFSYLEEQLQGCGVKTELILHDAYISLPLESSLAAGGERLFCRAASMSAPTAPGGLTGELVYVPALSRLNREACAGKIAMVDGRATYANVSAAERAGALAVVCVQQRRITECIASNAWGSPTARSKELIPKIPAVSIDDRCFARLRALGDAPAVTLRVEMDSGWRKIPLLVGEVPAAAPTDRFVMFSGHVDSWYYGAIDNATVNATQLEMARLAMLRRGELRRGLRVVFFSGHSHGRYAGSSWYADHRWLDLHENCVVNVNADCLGGAGAEVVTKSMMMPETRPVASELVLRYTGERFEGLPCQRKADQSFWINGVSSAFASFSRQREKEPTGSDLGWWWHTPEDTFDKVDPKNLERDALILTGTVLRFLTDERLPLRFDETARELAGVLLDYAAQSKGRFDLSGALSLAETLQSGCQALYRGAGDPERFNTLLLSLGRILVPLGYTDGNLYENPAGLPNRAMPSLAPIERLARTAPDSPEEKELLVELAHGRNFVEHSLTRANRLIGRYLAADGGDI